MLCCASAAAFVQDEYPAPNGKSNRILSMVVAFSLSRMDPLMLTFNGHQSMCESGWDVQFAIFTAQTVSARMRRYLENKLYCHRIEVCVQTVEMLLTNKESLHSVFYHTDKYTFNNK